MRRTNNKTKQRRKVSRVTATKPTIRRNSSWLATVEARRRFPKIPYKQITFYPSDYGGCLRKLWYAFNGHLTQGRESSRNEDRMDGGSWFEHKFNQQLTEAGYPNLSSVRVAVPEWNVSGKADNCYLEEEGGNLYLVEMKATNRRNYESILRCDVSNLKKHLYFGRYYNQLQIYLKALNDLGVAVQGRILLFCFDDSRRESFDIDLDDKTIEEAETYYKEARETVKAAGPPPVPMGHQPVAPPCSWCPARALCWG